MYFNGVVMVFACWKVHFPSVNILKAGAILTGLVFNEKICKNIYGVRQWGLTPPGRARWEQVQDQVIIVVGKDTWVRKVQDVSNINIIVDLWTLVLWFYVKLSLALKDVTNRP